MEMRENIKIGLLSVIALTLIYGTFIGNGGGQDEHDHGADPTPSKSTTITPLANNNDVTSTPAPLPPVEEPTGPATMIQFAENAHDFGNIKQESENKHMFRFTNTGAEPLIISNAKGSCGCTVPKYPKEPIPPGATGEIEVVYKPGKQKGNQTKTVTVTANTEPRDTRITIQAQVEELPS